MGQRPGLASRSRVPAGQPGDGVSALHIRRGRHSQQTGLQRRQRPPLVSIFNNLPYLYFKPNLHNLKINIPHTFGERNNDP